MGRGVKERLYKFWADNKKDFIAVFFILISAALFFYPALLRGFAFGPYDQLSAWAPLGSGLYDTVHNYVNSDQIQEMAPWYMYNWTIVHSGQFPLWNPYSLLGLPQFFNFQSAVLSLPNLVSYLFPMQYSYLIIVFLQTFIAGTGAYVLARVLGMTPVAAFFVGITFELSGGFAGELGWTLSGVNAWLGWMLALCILIRSRPDFRRWAVPALGTVIAFSIYAGFPEANAETLMLMSLFLVLWFIRDLRRGSVREYGSFFLWTMTSLLLGAGLSAPLWLPGLQLADQSGRLLVTTYQGLPLRSMISIFLPGFYGYPTTSSTWFGPNNYYELDVYIGPIAVIFLLSAIFGQFKKPPVATFTIASIIILGVIYDFGIFQWLIDKIPRLGVVEYSRMRADLDLCLSVLAGFGFEDEFEHWRSRGTSQAFRNAFLTTSLMFVLLLPYVYSRTAGLTGAMASIRSLSFEVDALLLFLIAIIIVFIRLKVSLISLGACLLVASQLTFLIYIGAPVNSYSKLFFPKTPAMAQVKSLVGTHLLGTINPNSAIQFSGLGFLPESNIAYGVREMSATDPMIPENYVRSWSSYSGVSLNRISHDVVFSPSIDSIKSAELYGIQYVIDQPYSYLRLSKNEKSIVHSSLKMAHLEGSVYGKAVAALFRVYLSRPDVEAAFPSTNPNFIHLLLNWTEQFQHETSTDPSANILRPYRKQLQDILVAFNRYPSSTTPLERLIHASTSLNGLTLVDSTPQFTLYRARGSNTFSLSPAGHGEILSHEQVNNFTYKITYSSPSETNLIARITNVPGWNASLNGTQLGINSYHSVMQRIHVPAGKNTIYLTYWPNYFSLGILIYILSVAALTLSFFSVV